MEGGVEGNGGDVPSACVRAMRAIGFALWPYVYVSMDLTTNPMNLYQQRHARAHTHMHTRARAHSYTHTHTHKRHARAHTHTHTHTIDYTSKLDGSGFHML